MPMGSYSGGGASSSSLSNLSPLAPPFMLDKPFSNPHPNPSTNIAGPSYGTLLDHPVSLWNPLRQSSSGSNYLETGSRSTSYQLPYEAYKQPDSQLDDSSSSAHLLALNSVAKAVYDDFSCEQYSNAAPGPLVGAADPYHPLYSMPNPTSDHDLMTHNEPNYDLLTSFGTGPQGGYTHVDDMRSFTGVHYTPQWNGLWNGSTNEEQGKWLDLGGTFGTKDQKSSSDSCITQSYANQGPYAFGGFVSFAETPSVSTNCSQDVGRGDHFEYLGIVDDKSLDEANIRASAPSFATVPTLVSKDVLNGNPDLQNQFQKPFCRVEKTCDDSSGDYTSYASSYVFDSAPAMGSLPPAVKEAAFSEFTSTECPFFPTKRNVTGNDVVDKPQNCPEDAHFGQKEHCRTLGFSCQLSNMAGTAHSLFPGSSFAKPEKTLPKKPDHEGGFTELFKTQSVSEAPQLRITDFLKSKTDNSKNLCSVEKPSDGPDVQNTAEDSPCWKGAPSAHFSPFEGSSIVSPELVVEKLELGNGLKGEGLEKGLLNTTAIQVQTAKKAALEPSCISGECDDGGSCAAPQRLFNFGLSGRDGLFSFKNNFKTAHSSKSSQATELNSDDRDDASGKKFTSWPIIDAVEDGKCVHVSSSGASSVASTIAEHNIPSSPSGNEAPANLNQLPRKDLDVKLDIGRLVSTMKSISELLSCHCSSNPAAAQEIDCEALKFTISNLDSCLMKEIASVSPIEQFCPPQKNVSSPHEVTQAGMDDKIDHAQVKKVPAVDADRHGHDILKIPRCDIFKRKIKDLFDSPFIKEDGVTKDEEIVQAIKRVLVDSLSCEGEMRDETFLYKNLWLEAEAALCAITARARFYRMKIEMMKSTSQKINAMESVLSLNFPTDVNKVGNRAQMEEMESPKTNEVENVKGSLVSPKMHCASELPPSDGRRSAVIEVDDREPPTPRAKRNSDPKDMDSSVFARRLRFLKSLCNVDLTKLGELKSPVVETQIGDILAGSDDSESSLMSRFKVLKSRADHLDSSKTNGTKSPINESVCCLQTLDHSAKDSYFSSSSSYETENGDDDHEAGVMARFNILKNLMEVSGQMKDEPQFDGLNSRGLESSKQSSSITENLFTTKHVDDILKDDGVEVNGATSANQAAKACRMGGELLEGWYDCTPSDWEHIVREDFVRQNC